MSEEQPQVDPRPRPITEEFRRFVRAGWDEPDVLPPQLTAAASAAAVRRAAIGAAFPGQRLIIPAGGLKVRSNDTDYAFRPHSAFAHLTGLGTDREPDAVLVLEPTLDGSAPSGHEAILYFRPRAERDSEEFFADTRYGEFWVGPRPSLSDLEAELGVRAADIQTFADAAAKDAGVIGVRLVRDADQHLAASLDQARVANGASAATLESQDHELAHALSLARMVKDDWEIEQLQAAVDATKVAFEAVVSQLPDALTRGRGERWVEGVFGLHARHQGNGVGYDSIAASGDHANTLHWVKNDGHLVAGDLLLLDAGVELDSLFTADITRTLPVSGRFTPAQRQVYDAVAAAQAAGIAAVKPGNTFSQVHRAAIAVIAQYLFDWGLLPPGVSVADTLDEEHGQYHRRWMVHGTSHHLGLDVHDCALATRAEYSEAVLRPGMVLTVEPGLYFKADDLLVPAELRGIGVRIEDDVVVTKDGCRNLSASFPHTSTEVEAWVAQLTG